MKTLRFASFFCVLVALGTSSWSTASADRLPFETSFSYSQYHQGSLVATDSDSVPSNTDTELTTPVGTYVFDLDAVPEDAYHLKAAVEVHVDIDQRSAATNWDDIRVKATSISRLEDQVFVNGPAGATAGQIEFFWAVTGQSEINFEPDGAVVAETLKTVGSLTSTVAADIPDLFLHDESGALGEVDSEQPGVSGFKSFLVDWMPGTTIPIEFTLEVVAELRVQGFDAAGFEADMVADFGNTAILQQINIYDGGGVLLDDASLVSSNDGFVYNVAAVPEPSSAILLGMTAWLFGMLRYSRRA